MLRLLLIAVLALARADVLPRLDDDGQPLLTRQQLLDALERTRLLAPRHRERVALHEHARVGSARDSASTARLLSGAPLAWDNSTLLDAELSFSVDTSSPIVRSQPLKRPSSTRPIAIATPRSCNALAVNGAAAGRSGSCGALLSACLVRVVMDAAGTCDCYRAHAGCYRQAGCAELLPRAHVRYCLDALHCSLSACEGSGAGAAGLATWAVAGAALVVAALAR